MVEMKLVFYNLFHTGKIMLCMASILLQICRLHTDCLLIILHGIYIGIQSNRIAKANC